MFGSGPVLQDFVEEEATRYGLMECPQSEFSQVLSRLFLLRREVELLRPSPWRGLSVSGGILGESRDSGCGLGLDDRPNIAV